VLLRRLSCLDRLRPVSLAAHTQKDGRLAMTLTTAAAG
jgi:hypothetical protein